MVHVPVSFRLDGGLPERSEASPPGELLTSAEKYSVWPIVHVWRDEAGAQRAATRFAVGQHIPCWVNPEARYAWGLAHLGEDPQHQILLGDEPAGDTSKVSGRLWVYVLVACFMFAFGLTLLVLGRLLVVGMSMPKAKRPRHGAGAELV